MFANAGLYGIVVSDGVGNLPVPEPEALLLAIVGLASVGGRPVRLAFRVTRPT